MKKLVLGLGLAVLAFAPTAKSQVIFTQDFETPTTIPTLPTGWMQGSTGVPGWKTATFGSPTTTGWAGATGATPAAHPGQIALVDDWNDSGTVSAPISNLHDTLKSPVFSLAGSTAAWLNFDFYFYNAARSASVVEEGKVIGSTDGGATWTVLQDLAGDGFDGLWSKGHVSLSSLGTGTNVMVGFVYSDDNDHMIGLAVDNIQAINLTASTAAVAAVDYNSVQDGISSDGQTVSFWVQNTGVAITSLKAKYTINGVPVGAPETFSSLSIAPYAYQKLTFALPIAGSAAGSNALKVVITDVNSSANADVDSAMTSNYVKASSTTGRWGLIEEFSSSTCPPCKSFNEVYDPLCVTNAVNTVATKVNVIKYQMNWPSPGTDRSYNSDGTKRRSYYGVNSIPEHFVNGASSTAAGTSSALTAEMMASKANASFMDMSMTYTVDTVTKKLGVTLNVTPHFTKTGSYRVHIVVMDSFYTNTTNTTGQLNYYHIMRQMLPDGNGTTVSSWTDGTTQTFTQVDKAFTHGHYMLGSGSYPTQNSFKFWNNPYNLSEVVAFVQDNATGSILQSLWGKRGTSSTTLIPTTDKIENIALYPNPTSSEATLSFSLVESGRVQVAVMDYTGKVLSVVSDKEMGLGTQSVKISTADLASGNYIVTITTASGRRADKLTVIK
ncbi:hypothetical protein GCM10023093_14680 [Nemorincola caseinilytica]|uniref:Secretion system C-terminal sorting domain-containing protein n=1 Tax=Nemorincola caseinilytica TaxID=2054315 RepID=A0ABP8NB85_9BACT